MNQTETTAQEELFHIQESTNDDGTVDVEITDWQKLSNGRMTVEFQLPTVETQTERMDWPAKDTDDYKFVRLVRHCGYDLASADQIIGETVKADDGELVAPVKKSPKDIVRHLFDWNDFSDVIIPTSVAIALWPLFYPASVADSFKGREAEAVVFARASTAAVVWFVLFIIVVFVI